MFNTPILFLIFNRPDVTAQVFAKIREIKPKYLFVAADGYRIETDGEAALCDQTRKLVLDAIDWECEVKILFREKNLGCGLAVSGAINWFFENVEEGIILEDDCLPDFSFFNYCEYMLFKHRDNHKIMHVNGTIFCNNYIKSNDYSFFSKYALVWGWATWRRAWKNYSFDLLNNEFNKILLKDNIGEEQKNYWEKIIKNIKQINTWDYQWTLAVLSNSGLCITPSKNLIVNIGFNGDYTHTNKKPDYVHSKAYSIVLSDLTNHEIIEKYDEFIDNILVPKKSVIRLLISQFKYFKNKWIK